VLKQNSMSLEIVIGPMFSGKSSYAVQYIRRKLAIGMKVLVVKPSIDKRYSPENVLVTHNKETVPCITWDTDEPIVVNNRILGNPCIVIEEAQFFKGLRDFVTSLLKLRSDILLIGLNGDAFQKPFGEIHECIPLATDIKMLNALCCICRDGSPGSYSKRIAPDSGQVHVGGAESYIAVCFRHLDFPPF